MADKTEQQQIDLPKTKVLTRIEIIFLLREKSSGESVGSSLNDNNLFPHHFLKNILPKIVIVSIYLITILCSETIKCLTPMYTW